jgi:8-oxo-dGTP diphosphatase
MKKQAVMIILEEKGKFLLGKRSLLKSKAPGYWCPISGHIEEYETEQAAVIRESKEELGVDVLPLRKIATILSDDGTVLLHWWKVKISSGQPTINNNENEAIGWFSKEELKDLCPVFEEDIQILLNLL